jgi:hypothetical protein
LAEHQKLQDLNGWVHIRNPEANPTRKIRNAAIQFRDGLKAKTVTWVNFDILIKLITNYT